MMWSISIYNGDSPFTLKPLYPTPVLTKDHITDIPADFVADPFMLQNEGRWYMFMEVMNAEMKKGEVGLATSYDGLNWTYQQIVLNERFHLSYPYVFKFENEFFMLPETLGAGAVCLYKAGEFPSRWSCVARLLEGRFADPSLFHYNDRWWLFVCSTPYQHDTLRLYFANALTGPWSEHPKSPIVSNDKRRARPAGRVIEFNNRLIRFAQDCVPQYGSSVRAFEIRELTANSYTEVEIEHSPILKASGNGWNASGMHHIDAHRLQDAQWLACVDGTR
jgi:beta-xylosidase